MCVANISRAAATPRSPPRLTAAIAQADFTPTAAQGPPSDVSRFRLLDAYAAVAFKNNQISFGKQSLWWGPNFGGPMLYSDNAEPITMLRYDRVSPFKLPSFLGVLGPMRVQFFIGQLSGQQFVNIPIPGQTGAVARRWSIRRFAESSAVHSRDEAEREPYS